MLKYGDKVICLGMGDSSDSSTIAVGCFTIVIVQPVNAHAQMLPKAHGNNYKF